jgi:hypothetical protein
MLLMRTTSSSSNNSAAAVAYSYSVHVYSGGGKRGEGVVCVTLSFNGVADACAVVVGCGLWVCRQYRVFLR